MKIRGFYKFVACLCMFTIILGLFSGKFTVAQAAGNEVYVTTSKELITALRYASPGDEIVVAPGEYVGALGTGSNGSGLGSAWFYSDVDGSAENPITVRCEDMNNKPVLKGSWQGVTGLLISGDYWVISGLEITFAQKGLILDNSNHSIIKECVVHGVLQEGIHLRDGSSYNLIENCSIYDTGTGQAGFGEGIYIGSDNGKWTDFIKECDYNIVRSCELGPNIAAEHVDIKEGTTGTIIENCVMHGTGISGQNYADSFIDAKGNSGVIRYNTCYQEDNSVIVDAFQTHQQVDGWGLDNVFIYNTIYLTDSAVNIVNGVNNAAAFAYGNISNLSVNETIGNVTMLTKNEADKLAGENTGEVETPTEPESATGQEVATNANVKINGCQISTTTGGHRIVYSLSDSQDEVEKVGMIYCIETGVADDNMVVGGKNTYSFEATSAGLYPGVSDEDSSVQTYAMTMKFADNENYEMHIRVRAYAQLKTGAYIYSDVKGYSVYNVADYLYKNLLMHNISSHTYLYDNILSVVNPDYEKINYPYQNTIVKF